MNQFQKPTEQEIADYAYYLWESEGRISGRDLDYWLQAKAHFTAVHQYELAQSNDQKTASDAKPERVPAETTTSTSRKPGRKRQGRSNQEPAYA